MLAAAATGLLELLEGDPALQVGARANDFDGVETAPGTIVAGETYTVSARIRLAADVTGTREARFVHDFGATATPRSPSVFAVS